MKIFIFIVLLSLNFKASYAATYCLKNLDKYSMCFDTPKDCPTIKRLKEKLINEDDRIQLKIAQTGCLAREKGQETKKIAKDLGKWIDKNAAPVTEFFKGFFDE